MLELAAGLFALCIVFGVIGMWGEDILDWFCDTIIDISIRRERRREEKERLREEEIKNQRKAASNVKPSGATSPDPPHAAQLRQLHFQQDQLRLQLIKLSGQEKILRILANSRKTGRN